MKKIIFVLSILFSITATAQSVLVVQNVDSFFQGGKWYYTISAATPFAAGLASPQHIQDINKAKTDIIALQGSQGGPINLSPIIYAGTSFIAADSAVNRVIVCTSNNPINFVIPAGLKSGFNCRVTQAGNGTISFISGSGCKILNRSKYFRSSLINSDISIYNTLPNTYNLCGQLKL